MYFSKVSKFRDIAVGSENVAVGLTPKGEMYSKHNKSGSGEHWYLLPPLPSHIEPWQIDCAADGTVAAFAKDGNVYLYTGGQWRPITADIDGESIRAVSIGSINNVLLMTNEGSVWRYYAYGVSKKIYSPGFVRGSSEAYLIGTTTDGTTVARFSESTGRTQDIFQYFPEVDRWADIMSDGYANGLAVSPSDANTIYLVTADFKLIKYLGNAVGYPIALNEVIYDKKTYKYKSIRIPGQLVGVNAGTDNRISIVMKDSHGDFHAYLSIPAPQISNLLPEMDIPEQRVPPTEEEK